MIKWLDNCLPSSTISVSAFFLHVLGVENLLFIVFDFKLLSPRRNENTSRVFSNDTCFFGVWLNRIYGACTFYCSRDLTTKGYITKSIVNLLKDKLQSEIFSLNHFYVSVAL